LQGSFLQCREPQLALASRLHYSMRWFASGAGQEGDAKGANEAASTTGAETEAAEAAERSADELQQALEAREKELEELQQQVCDVHGMGMQ